MADYGTSADRHTPRRRNKDVKKAVELAASGAVDPVGEYEPPMAPSEKWPPEVQGIFLAMRQDVMAQFMTPVAWAQLYLKCEAWSKEFKRKFLGIANDGTMKYGMAPVPAAVLADISKTLDALGGTEKARRDMKILIDPNPDGASASRAGDARMAAKKAIARPVRRQVEE